jgi:hypothetical protein
MRLVILLLASLSGCTCGTISPDEFARRYPYGEGRVYTRAGLAEIVAQLERRVGASPRVRNVSLNPGSATFTVQDPKRPENLDDHTYSYFKWQKTRPVHTSAGDTHVFFALRDAPLDRIPDLIAQATRELAIEDSRVSGVSISAFGEGSIELQLSVTGPRQSGTVRFDGAGNLIEKQIH